MGVEGWLQWSLIGRGRIAYSAVSMPVSGRGKGGYSAVSMSVSGPGRGWLQCGVYVCE